jgi:GntR family transcriptional regulator, transcriptional repressor for pyruvate dehydrogenase complex
VFSNMPECSKFGLALESLSARLAARERTRHDLVSLENAVRTHGELLKSGEDPSEADTRFHLLLGIASRNSLLQHQVEQVMAVLGQQLWRTMKMRSLSDAEHAATYLSEHRLVLERVKAGDSDGAAEAMNAHLDSIEVHLLALVS